jgi:hypothetical protein
LPDKPRIENVREKSFIEQLFAFSRFAAAMATRRNPYLKARKQVVSLPARLAGTHPFAVAALPVVVGTVSTYRQSDDAGYGGLSTFGFVMRLTVVACAIECGESLSCTT